MKSLIFVNQNIRFSKTATVVLIGVCVLLSIFIPIAKTKAAEWYDTGWINASDARFHGDMITNECPGQVGTIATVILSYMGDPWRAWVNVNAPAGNYKIDMKLGYTHRVGHPDQTNETMRLYSKTGITSTAVPTNYTDKANVADLDSHTINPDRECADLANSIHTYSNVIGGTLKFSENGDLFIQGTGGSINVKAVRIYGYKEHENPAPTCSISANPSSISNGQSSTLSWTSTNATSCTASNAWSGAKPLSGTQYIFPSFTSTYVLTCTGAGGSVNCSVPVSVTEPGQPNLIITKSVDRYYANPNEEIVYTLIYQNTGSTAATNVVIRDAFVNQNQGYLTFISSNMYSSYGNDTWNIGTVNAGQSGTITIRARISNSMPNSTTEIQNRASIDSNETSLIYSNYVSTIVTYNPGSPTCSISANPSSISNGQSSTLSWTSTNATSCTASNAWSGAKSLSGSQSVSPSSNGTYSLNCSGPGGSVNCSAWVSVNTVNPTYVLAISKMGRNISRGQIDWADSFIASPSEEIEFSIQVTNNGSVSLSNVKVWDVLPANISIIAGSTTIDNVSWGGDVIDAGLNLGTLNQGQTKTIKFRATLADKNKFSTGITTLVNLAYASADNTGQTSDQASVVIGKGQVLGASVVTGAGFIPYLFSLMIISLVIAFFVYCSTRENQILDYLGKENGNKILKGLIKFYFKAKLVLKLATLRFKQTYF